MERWASAQVLRERHRPQTAKVSLQKLLSQFPFTSDGIYYNCSALKWFQTFKAEQVNHPPKEVRRRAETWTSIYPNLLQTLNHKAKIIQERAFPPRSRMTNPYKQLKHQVLTLGPSLSAWSLFPLTLRVQLAPWLEGEEECDRKSWVSQICFISCIHPNIKMICHWTIEN